MIPGSAITFWSGYGVVFGTLLATTFLAIPIKSSFLDKRWRFWLVIVGVAAFSLGLCLGLVYAPNYLMQWVDFSK